MQGMQERKRCVVCERERERERECVCVCVCVLFSTPLVFIAGSHQPQHPNRRCEPTGKHHVPWLRRWGPRAWPADQVGRSACPGRQLPRTSWSGLVLVSPYPKVEARPAPAGFASVLGLHLVHLSLNRTLIFFVILCRAKMCL